MTRLQPRRWFANLAVVVAAAALLLPVTGVSGHESDPFLELDPATVAPAGGVLVTGHGLDRAVTMRLSLEGTDSRVALGDVVIDAAGHFERLVALPVDLPAGVYGVKVSNGGELVVSSVLVIDAAAGPGQPIDRGPPVGLVLVLAVVGAVIALIGLRIGMARRRRAEPDGSGAPPV